MKILANRKVKRLFDLMLLFLLTFVLISTALIGFHFENAVIYLFVCALCMGFLILTVIYHYFREQNRIMESAITQIKEYLAGNQNARIECNDEGELYRLFHEVNSLVLILNAHAQNEETAKKFLKNTISDISHQLKTPLAALNIYNGILLEEAKDLPTIMEFTLLAEQELDRMETLVQNLLKITKFDAGTIVIEKTLENVSVLMNRIEQRFLYRSKQEGKKLYLEGDDTVSLLCDRNWLVEAVGNIVKNAFDHTKSEDVIRIEWKQFASIVQIIIKDNGSGIHPEDLHHIFKRFYRSRFSKDTQGIGLGLPLAKAIVEAHSGTISVDSELGSGTTFIIDFLIPTKL